jgi:hypothetical protein
MIIALAKPIKEEAMPVLAVFHSTMDKDAYEKLRRAVDWETDTPSGAMFHSAGTDENGHVHVADVWESQDQLNNFVQSRLMPAFMKAGLTPPDVSVYPTVNINAFSTIEPYRL